MCWESEAFLFADLFGICYIVINDIELMPKKTKQKKQGKKKIFTLSFIAMAITVILYGIFFMSHYSLADDAGWGKGIWNNTLEYLGGIERFWSATPEAPPAIGWLSSSSRLSVCNGALNGKYTLSTGGDPGATERPVRGAAWFGIGSETDSNGACQSDLPSLGWLRFDVGYPPFVQYWD